MASKFRSQRALAPVRPLSLSLSLREGRQGLPPERPSGQGTDMQPAVRGRGQVRNKGSCNLGVLAS